VLNEETVLGEESVAEENAVLMEGVKLWPGRHAPKGCRLTVSLTGRGWQQPPSFGSGGILQGVINEDITPQLMLQIGGALGAERKVGLGWAGGDGADMLARAAAAGIAASGGQVFAHDAATAAAGAWLAEHYNLPMSLFLEQEGETVYLSCFDSRGLPLDRARQRKLEGAVLRGETVRVPGSRAGHFEPVIGTSSAYIADAARRACFKQFPLLPTAVAVPGNTAADRFLAQALERMGCTVLRENRQGIAAFSADYGGRRLLAWDEDGVPLAPEGVLTLICLIEFENGEGKVAVLPSAPAAIETMAAARGCLVLRLGRDGAEAEDLYRNLPWLRDSVFAACRICARMGAGGERLKVLADRIPRFALHRREVSLRGSRGAIMEALASKQTVSAGEGLRVRLGEGWVYITPLARRSALRVVGEGYDTELAAELCDFYVEKVTQLDKDLPDQSEDI
jgi:mannose-1-phosphate guanylyltransferase/phosphomannomutase